jgi:hypothetical protein
MRFDPSGLNRAFDRMEKSAQAKGKTMVQVQGGIFLGILKKMERAVAPTKDEIYQVYQKLNWRLKRKKGVTPFQEMLRRQRQCGNLARQWVIDPSKSSSQTGHKIRIWLLDKAHYSGVVEARNGTSKQAATVAGSSWKSKLETYAKQVTGVF